MPSNCDCQEQLNTLNALARVLVDGQAWLYASNALPPTASEENFTALMDEWKEETAALVQQSLTGATE